MRPDESFVGQDIRSLQTMLRVIAEYDPRLPITVPDGIYSQDTMNAVSSFQRTRSLPVTGVTDQATWDAVVQAYELALIQQLKPEPIQILLEPGQIIRAGEYHPNLYLLQAMLAFLATIEQTIPGPDVNGTLDGPTAQALAAFQALAGLPPTGQLDKLTWKYLVQQYISGANRRIRRGAADSPFPLPLEQI